MLAPAAAGAAPPGQVSDGPPSPSFRLGLVDITDPTAADDAGEALTQFSESLRLDLAEAPIDTAAAMPGMDGAAAPTGTARQHRLPFLGEAAREAGYELPLTYGAGGVYYYLSRAIDITEVRVGRNGAAVAPVPDFVDLGSNASVNNVNAKFDVWLLPFLNVYAIAGYIWNKADTRLDLTLPALAPGGPARRRSLEVPTELQGTVGGLGVTLAGGYKSLFFAGDVNVARADLGFDDKFDAIVSSLRVGWNGKLGARPFRAWLNSTYWDTATVARGSVADPDGGILDFEVDQGPSFPWTYGVGAQYDISPAFNLASDIGWDFSGGWYLALVPVFRF
jgi:hypothetical protein